LENPLSSARSFRDLLDASLTLALAVFLSAVVPAVAWGQSASEIIRGRVFGPDSQPLAGAEVRVTGLVTRATQIARSDARGLYTLVFANAEGEYVAAIRRVGYRSTSFRLSRLGPSPVLGADVYLVPASQVLERVTVMAGPPASGERSAIGELGTDALADSLFLADPARLMELLLSIPGISALDDSTFSVLGAAANQNITTLDGVSVRGGGGLPPDALASVRIVTSSADPARGGFAGGNISQTLRGGTDIFGGTLRFSTSNRGLVWNDPEWTRPSQRPIDHSGTANGPIVKEKVRYNVSWSLEDNISDRNSLLEPRAPLLAQRGISLDSVDAVTAALRGLGVPLSVASGPSGAFNRSLRTTEVIDFSPSATTSLRLSHSGNWQRSVGTGSETSFPTRINEVGVSAHSFGLRATGYVRGLLNELTVGYNYYADDSDPATLLPAGSVRIGTDFSDGRTGLTSLSFGGGDGNYYEQSSNGEATNELSWLQPSGTHKVKIGGRIGFNRSSYFYFPGNPLLGSYTYLTLEDLVANKPSSYDRIITSTARNTRARSTSVWIGDEWKVSDALQVQGGMRADFTNPGTLPRYNAAVEETFGVRTDQVPRDVGLSPRIGFSWSSAARLGRGTAGGSATMGGMSAAAISRMSPELVTSIVSMQRASTLPGIGVTGTIGAYRGTISPNTIAELVESTGLPGTRVTLSCVGDAVPVPDWSTITEGPTACADGTSGTTFSLSRPLVRVFDPSFRAPISWRANLGVNGIRVPWKWIVSINGGFSINRNNQSTIDLNLNRTPHFHLSGEGGRPVYAPLAAVVPASGAISPGASRISPGFAAVSSMLSDLSGYQTQLQASITPPNPLFNRRVNVNLSYSLNVGRSEARGNSRIGTTGDPFARQWVRNNQPAHTFRLTSTGRISAFNFGVNAFLYSGIPFTPLVSGDVNGDGNSGNDRAFVFDPSSVADTSLSRQLNDLIARAPAAASRCLTTQRGRMAGANTCRTPWQARIDINASLTPPSGWSHSDRLRLTFNLSNANGALVRALGLEQTPFGQSPLSTTPVSTLLYVTGFDPVAQQFMYRVNQTFGQPTNFASARRKFAPAQLQLGFEYVFGGPVLNPIARGLGLREPANEGPLTDEQRRAAVARLKKDPVAPYVASADSIGLSAEQRASLEELSSAYHARADTALTPLRDWVLSRKRRIFDRDLGQRLSAAQGALARLSTEFSGRASAILTAEQLSRFKETSERKEK
jgi:hypothetical protein